MTAGPPRPALRVVRCRPLHPALELAVDATLLEDDAGPALRVHGWSPAGLSLGRFQDADAFRDVPGSHVLVRRPTGGGAIYHDDELTLALTLDGEDAWPTEVAYERVHDAVIRALARVGVRAARLTAGGPPQRARALRAAWCFETPGRHDVVGPDGRKLFGSAQRRVERPRRRVLHHGSLVLRSPAATPFCASVADQVDVAAVRSALADALIEEVAAELGLEPRATDLTPDEFGRARARAAAFLVDRPAEQVPR